MDRFREWKMRCFSSEEARAVRRRRLSRVKYYIKVFLAHLFSTAGLCSLVILYSILGAITFEWLERDHEIGSKLEVAERRSKCAMDLWLLTMRLNVLYPDNWTDATMHRLKQFENEIVEYVRREGYDGIEANIGAQWSFSGALLYSITVITTIGYGNVTCRTMLGQVVTVIYALFGIPIMFLCLANLGNLMANTFKFSYKKIVFMCCCCSQNSLFARIFCRSRIKKKKEKLKQELELQNSDLSNTKITISNSNLSDLSESENENDQNDDDDEVFEGKNEKKNENGNSLSPSRSPKRSPKSLSPKNTEVNLFNDNKGKAVTKLQVKETKSTPITPLNYSPNSSSTRKKYSLQQNINNKSASLHQRSQSLKYDLSSALTTKLNTDLLKIERHKKPKTKVPDDSDRVPIIIVLMIVVGYIIGGAMLFSIWEGWNPLEGAYFCFITLSTIGFGDYVPGAAIKPVQDEEGQIKLIICCAYLITGLSLLAMSFNLVQEEIVIRCRGLATRIGILPQKKDFDEPKPIKV